MGKYTKWSVLQFSLTVPITLWDPQMFVKNCLSRFCKLQLLDWHKQKRQIIWKSKKSPKENFRKISDKNYINLESVYCSNENKFEKYFIFFQLSDTRDTTHPGICAPLVDKNDVQNYWPMPTYFFFRNDVKIELSWMLKLE